MKRIFLLIALVGMMTAGAHAQQRPLVILSHDGELSFFSELTAFETALDSAKNGDTIYLSEGNFTTNSNEITIDKRVSIVGCGYKSYILADLYVDMRENPNSYMDAPLFDGVRLKKLCFSSSTNSQTNLKEVTISRVKIKELQVGALSDFLYEDFLIDGCYIENANGLGKMCFKNSKISVMSLSEANNCEMRNCNIGMIDICPRLLDSSIIGETNMNSGTMGTYGTHAVYNSFFHSPEMVASDYILTENCYIDPLSGQVFNDNLEVTWDLKELGYLGQDGTVIGIYGGLSPYSETPSVPTVDPANSSVTLDKDKNQLNVTITVKE